MALKFSGADAVSDLYIDKFGGVDFSTAPSKVSLNRSDDAKNMIMNKDGFIEKRCGYKKLFEGEGDVNGIFEYIADSNNGRKSFYFVHRKNALYRFDFDGKTVTMHDTPLLEGLSNVKSRCFFMGGAMFIIGGGRYIKISYDTTFDVLVYGFVDECDTQKTEALLIKDRRINSFSGQKFDYNAKNLYLKISYAKATCTFAYGQTGTKFYIAGPDAKNIRVITAFVDSKQVDFDSIDVRTDGSGTFAYIRCLSTTGVPNATVKECSVDIVISQNNFVYTPAIIIGRKNVIRDEDEAMHYTGTVLESVNLISRKRAVEIEYTHVYGSDSNVSYVYLENKASLITGVYLNSTPAIGDANEVYINKDCPVGLDTSGNIKIYQDRVPFTTKTLRVEYVAKSGDTEKINRCSIFGLFGGENDTRVFLAGDRNNPETDYASALYEATYFPDTGYTKIGSDSSAIVGYHKLYSNQIIIKDGEGADASQYIRKFDLDDNGKAYFPVSQGALGYGASNISSFKTVNDMPMFAGSDGVFSIEGTTVENQNNTVCRSKLINAKLQKENIGDGICAVKDNKYYLFFGSDRENDGRMYIYDTDMGEWFYFADLPEDIRCLWIYKDRLCFGRKNGEMCMFLNAEDENAYYDNVGTCGSLASARGIEAYWSVPRSNMGNGMMKKTVLCTYATCQKYHRSGAKMFYRSDFGSEYEAAGDNCDLFWFSDVDFNRFSFDTVSCPTSVNSHIKDKRPDLFGMKIKNSNPGEPFGLLGFGIRYRTGRYIK